MASSAKLTKIKVNSASIARLLKGGEVAADLSTRANAIRSSLPTSNGEKWIVVNGTSKDRAHSIVKAANAAARKTAATSSSLQGAIGAGR